MNKLKKTMSFLTAAVMAISLFGRFSVSAEEAGPVINTAAYDFNDGQNQFTAVERCEIGVAAYDDAAVTKDYYQTATSGGNASNKYALAYLDLSSFTEDAETATLSFDSRVSKDVRTYISLYDTKLRGDNAGGSSKASYSQTGDLLYFGTKDGASYYMNGAKNSKVALGEWNRTTVSVDFEKAVLSYKIQSLDGTATYAEAENMAFADENCRGLSGIEIYAWGVNNAQVFSIDNIALSATIAQTSIDGPTEISKVNGTTVTQQYILKKAEDANTITWSVEGVEGVTIDSETGILSVPSTAGTGTAAITAQTDTGIVKTYKVNIKDFALAKTVEIPGTTTMQTGDTTSFVPVKILDENDCDVTQLAAVSYASSNPEVISITEDGQAEAKANGTAKIIMTIDTGAAQKFTKEYRIRIGNYELKSSDLSIDISPLVSYDTTIYRVYQPDGTYRTVEANNGVIENTTGGEVIVVPDYRFETSSGTCEGYVEISSDDAALYPNTEKGYGLKTKGGGLEEYGYKFMGDRPFIIDLPDGYYDITVYKPSGGREDLYINGDKLVQNLGQSGQNRTSSETTLTIEQVKVKGGQAVLTTEDTNGNFHLARLEFVKVPDAYRKHHIYLAGDSTVSSYYPYSDEDAASELIKQTGWGQVIKNYLTDEYAIVNLAEAGQYAKGWYDNTYASVLSQAQPGDTLLIQFGINDSNKPAEYSSDKRMELMKQTITAMVEGAKEIGVTPILINSMHNAKYGNRTAFYEVIPDFARELGVGVINLNGMTKTMLSNLGDDWMRVNYSIDDNLHMSYASASLCASIVAAGLERYGYHTTDYKLVYQDMDATEKDAQGRTIRGVPNGTVREYGVSNVTVQASLTKIVNGDGSVTTQVVPVSFDGNQKGTVMLYMAKYKQDHTLDSVKVVEVTNTTYTTTEEYDKAYVWSSSMQPVLGVTE